MPKEGVYEVAREILARVLKIDAKEINPHSTLEDDLGIDSVDFWDIISGFEKRFGVRISVEEAGTLNTVLELVTALELKLKGR